MHPETPESLAVRYTAEAADVEQVYIRAWVHRGEKQQAPALSSRAKFWWTAGLIASLLGAGGVFVSMAQGWIPGNGLVAVAAIAGPLLCASMLSPPKRRKGPVVTEEKAREAARAATARISYGPHEINVSGEGFRCDTDYYQLVYRWPCIVGVETTAEAVYVHVIGEQEFRIPNRSFGTEVPRERFITVVRGWMALRGADMEARFVTLARVHRLVCLTCGYSLAELTRARCPECGRELTLDNYPMAESVLPDRAAVADGSGAGGSSGGAAGH